MISISELWRRTQGMVVTGSVEESKSANGKMLVRIKYSDKNTGEEHVSKFLPVMTKNNKLMKIWMPLEKGEQVTVLRPFGDNDGGLVIPSLHWKGNKESVGANEHSAIVEFKDGCVIKYDTQTGRLSVHGAKKIKFVATDNISLIAKDLTFFSSTLTHNGVNVGFTHVHPACIKCGGAL